MRTVMRAQMRSRIFPLSAPEAAFSFTSKTLSRRMAPISALD
jgi:hypothetical protein